MKNRNNKKKNKKNIEQDNTSKIYTFFKPINNKETPELRISNNKLVHTDVRRDIHSTVFQTTASTPEVDLPTNPVINLQNSLVTGLPGRTEDRSVRQMLNHGSANLLLEKKGVMITFLGVRTPPSPPTLMDSNGIFSLI